MKLTDREKAAILIAMRNHTDLELRRGSVTLLVAHGGGPWGQDMICGAVVVTPCMMARKWCRTLEELMEFLEWRIFNESL